MKTNHDLAIEMSQGSRGGFASHIGKAYCAADNSNRRSLEVAFPHLFNAPTMQAQCKALDLIKRSAADALELGVSLQPMHVGCAFEAWLADRTEVSLIDAEQVRSVLEELGFAW